MKKQLAFLSLLLLGQSGHLKSSPNSLGPIDSDRPPFFTDDFYQSTQNADDIYQQLLAEQEAAKQKTEGTS